MSTPAVQTMRRILREARLRESRVSLQTARPCADGWIMATDGVMAVWSREFPDPGEPWTGPDLFARAQPLTWTHQIETCALKRWAGPPFWSFKVTCDCADEKRRCTTCDGRGACPTCDQLCPDCDGPCPRCHGERKYVVKRPIREARLGDNFVDRKLISRAVSAFSHRLVKLRFAGDGSCMIWLTDGTAIACVMGLSHVTHPVVGPPRNLVELDRVEDSP